MAYEAVEIEEITTRSDYEIERGKPIPGKNHSFLQLRIGAMLLRYEQFTIFSELSLELDGWKCTPDVCVYPRTTIDWLHEETRLTEPPLLTIEILSRHQSADELLEKAEFYLQHGVQSCWIVLPAFRMITVLGADLKPVNYSSGTIHDPATGVTVAIEEVFRS